MNKYILIDLEWTLFNSQTINEDILPYVLKDMSDFVSGNLPSWQSHKRALRLPPRESLWTFFRLGLMGKYQTLFLKRSQRNLWNQTKP